MPKRVPLQSEWSDDEVTSLLDELRQESEAGSERSAILVGGAALDECLRRMIFEALPDRQAAEELLADDGRAPLGNFSARILAARALGLIDADLQSCITTVRKIRNKYAHKFGHAIDRRSVSDTVRELDAKVTLLTGDNEQTSPSDRELKIVFTGCVLGLLVILFTRALALEEQK